MPKTIVDKMLESNTLSAVQKGNAIIPEPNKFYKVGGPSTY